MIGYFQLNSYDAFGNVSVEYAKGKLLQNNAVDIRVVLDDQRKFDILGGAVKITVEEPGMMFANRAGGSFIFNQDPKSTIGAIVEDGRHEQVTQKVK